jgi:hypothetical protein
VKSAGDVTRAAFGDLGVGGGHRTMAKAIFPARQLARNGGDGGCQDVIVERFLKALGAGHRSADGAPA